MDVKVVGYGDNVADRYLNQNKMFPGGNCLNFSVYAKQAGIEAAYLGVFGEDEEARHIIRSLRKLNVDISKCKVERDSLTERCDVNIINGNRVFVKFDERENLHGILRLNEEELKFLEQFDLIHCSCYAEEESEIPKLKDLPGLCSFDFSEEEEYRAEKYLNQICPYIDFALFSCEGRKEESIKTLLKHVHEKNVPYVLATMGPEGQILYDGKEYYRGKAEYIQAVDTMGAGDSFCTAFLVSLLKAGWKKSVFVEKQSIYEAFSYAGKFAANNCLIEGSFGYAANLRGEV